MKLNEIQSHGVIGLVYHSRYWFLGTSGRCSRARHLKSEDSTVAAPNRADCGVCRAQAYGVYSVHSARQCQPLHLLVA